MALSEAIERFRVLNEGERVKLPLEFRRVGGMYGVFLGDLPLQNSVKNQVLESSVGRLGNQASIFLSAKGKSHVGGRKVTNVPPPYTIYIKGKKTDWRFFSLTDKFYEIITPNYWTDPDAKDRKKRKVARKNVRIEVSLSLGKDEGGKQGMVVA